MTMTDDEAEDEVAQPFDKALELAELAVMLLIVKGLARGDYAKAMAGVSDALAKMQRELDGAAIGLDVLIASAFRQMADDSDEWAKPYYEAAGVEQTPAKKDPAMKKTVEAGAGMSSNRMRDMLRTSVIGIVDTNGDLVPCEEYYRRKVSEAALAMTDEAYQTVIARTVSELSRGGLRVMYSSGNTRELYSAVRTNIMDTYRESRMSLRQAQGRAFGADGVQVSAHGHCADDHLPYQGRRYSNAEFERIQSRLDRPIAEGANCRHTTFPVIMGVGEGNDEAYLKRLKDQSQRKLTVTGLDGKKRVMTGYEATQYQRGIERRIRQAKRGELLETDKERAKRYRERAEALTDSYVSFSKQAKLTTRMDRIEIYEKVR